MLCLFPKPRICRSCGSVCYARSWSDFASGNGAYASCFLKVRWQCSSCGRGFWTYEHLRSVVTSVEELVNRGQKANRSVTAEGEFNKKTRRNPKKNSKNIMIKQTQ